MRRFALTLLPLALAACGGASVSKSTEGSEGGASATPAARPTPAAEPTLPAPDAFLGDFAAVSTNAEAITGEMTITPGMIAFDYDQKYRVGAPFGVDVSTFAHGKDVMLAPDHTIATVWPVLGEEVGKDAPNGSLCGRRDRVRFIAAVRDVKYGSDYVILAAFNSDQPPGPRMAENSICAGFTFVRDEPASEKRR